jgi:hypothetical protein
MTVRRAAVGSIAATPVTVARPLKAIFSTVAWNRGFVTAAPAAQGSHGSGMPSPSESRPVGFAGGHVGLTPSHLSSVSHELDASADRRRRLQPAVDIATLAAGDARIAFLPGVEDAVAAVRRGGDAHS